MKLDEQTKRQRTESKTPELLAPNYNDKHRNTGSYTVPNTSARERCSRRLTACEIVDMS